MPMCEVEIRLLSYRLSWFTVLSRGAGGIVLRFLPVSELWAPSACSQELALFFFCVVCLFFTSFVDSVVLYSGVMPGMCFGSRHTSCNLG